MGVERYKTVVVRRTRRVVGNFRASGDKRLQKLPAHIIMHVYRKRKAMVCMR